MKENNQLQEILKKRIFAGEKRQNIAAEWNISRELLNEIIKNGDIHSIRVVRRICEGSGLDPRVVLDMPPAPGLFWRSADEPPEAISNTNQSASVFVKMRNHVKCPDEYIYSVAYYDHGDIFGPMWRLSNHHSPIKNYTVIAYLDPEPEEVE